MTHFIKNGVKGVILGNGSSQFPGPDGTDIDTVAITPNNVFSEASILPININGNRTLYVTAHVVAMGTLTGNLSILIEFFDPSWKRWVPSRGFDGTNSEFREGSSTIAAQTWQIPMVNGQSHTVVSNEEHRHYTKARVRFTTSAAGAADAATRIEVCWYSDGGPPTVPSQ